MIMLKGALSIKHTHQVLGRLVNTPKTEVTVDQLPHTEVDCLNDVFRPKAQIRSSSIYICVCFASDDSVLQVLKF